jgi:Transposase IS66 family
VLVADAYGGYNGVVAGNQITRAGCWAHLRRKFVDAEKPAPPMAREAVERGFDTVGPIDVPMGSSITFPAVLLTFRSFMTLA